MARWKSRSIPSEVSDFNLDARIESGIRDAGYATSTPIQEQGIPVVLQGRDMFSLAQTGTGKTAAFMLPILQRLTQGHRAPHAEQIHDAVKALATGTGLRTATIYGGVGQAPQVRALRDGVEILVACPGRLLDLIDQRHAKLSAIEVLVLDEADRMLDMGFLPAITEILETMPETRQTLFFSATIEQSVAHLINNYLNNPVRIAIGSTTKPAEHVDLHVYEVEQDRKLGLLRLMLADEQGSFLVFARTKHGADRLSKKLSAHGVKAASIHGDRTQAQRNQALKGFQQGYYRVLVATDVAARGIHVDGIAHVVNFDLPQVPEDFIHRVGRTGRARRPRRRLHAADVRGRRIDGARHRARAGQAD